MSTSDESNLVQVGYEGLPGLYRGEELRYRTGEGESFMDVAVVVTGDPDGSGVNIRVISIFHQGPAVEDPLLREIYADPDDLYYL